MSRNRLKLRLWFIEMEGEGWRRSSAACCSWHSWLGSTMRCDRGHAVEVRSSPAGRDACGGGAIAPRARPVTRADDRTRPKVLISAPHETHGSARGGSWPP